MLALLVRSVVLLTMTAGLLPGTSCPGKLSDPNGLPPAAELSKASCQVKLLEIAFEAASAIPADPFIKDRSTAQQNVVETCLKLDQPERAIRYADGVANWRRGLCHADIAYYLARRDAANPGVQRGLELARQVAEQDLGQDWRRSEILVRVAQIETLLGQGEQAAALEAGLEEVHTGRVDITRAIVGEEAAYDRQLETLEALTATGNFETTRNALNAYVQLVNRFYADQEKRRQVEEKLRTAWDAMPLVIRLDLMLQLADAALSHDDSDGALEWVNAAQSLLTSAPGPMRYRSPLVSRLAQLRFRAGDCQRARADVDEELARFKAQRDEIINIYRAGILRSLAEACHVMGDDKAALEAYRQAVEAGVDNPNSRSRAEDLAATCCSMAAVGAEPDAALWARVRAIRNGLKAPW